VGAQVLSADQPCKDQRILSVAKQGKVSDHGVFDTEGHMLLQGERHRLLQLATVAEGQVKQALGDQFAWQRGNHQVRDPGLAQQAPDCRSQVRFVLGAIRLVGADQGKRTPRPFPERGLHPIIPQFKRQNALRHPS
jgi:hypothetical protein